MVKKFYSGTFYHATFSIYYAYRKSTFGSKSDDRTDFKKRGTDMEKTAKRNVTQNQPVTKGQSESVLKNMTTPNTPETNATGHTRTKSRRMLIIGLVLFVVSLICTMITHRSYLQEIKQPYAYSLTALFVAVMITVRGAYKAFIGVLPSQEADVRRVAQAGLLAALCYIGFAVFKIDIPVGTEKTAFHFGNVFCVLAALLLGGYWGGLAGAIGMTIADLTTAYVTSAPKTFLLKLMIGLVVGFVAHKLFHISREHTVKYITGATITASVCGMGFNVIADPLVGYFYKTYLLGVPQDIAKTFAKINTMTTLVNAIVAVVAATVFYLALRPALKKSGLFVEKGV